MATAKEICNMGLVKIGASLVNDISAPKSVLEKLCAAQYAQWRDSELRKRRWVFATKVSNITPTNLTPITDDDYAWSYNVPGDCLRPIRPRPVSSWVQRGRVLVSNWATIRLEYIAKKNDNELTDPNFLDVLAWRIAKECVEPQTQSNEKWNKAFAGYKDAVDEAASINAFILDPHHVDGPDEDYSWLADRLYPYG